MGFSLTLSFAFAGVAAAEPTDTASTKTASTNEKGGTTKSAASQRRKPSKRSASVVRTATDKGQPIWLNLQDGLKAAKSSGKFILVDVYTDWCHFCHKLDKEVFSVAPVAPYLAQNFVCVRINAEDGGEGQAFSQKMGVRGFPTSIFLDADGRALTMVPGFAPADAYLKKLQEIQVLKQKGVKGQSVR